jgi:hypothetical protein
MYPRMNYRPQQALLESRAYRVRLGHLFLERAHPGTSRLAQRSPGIGRIVLGMIRPGYDLQLTRYGEEGWRPTFYRAGLAHSHTSAVGSAWEPTPWLAVQHAAWESLVKAERLL